MTFYRIRMRRPCLKLTGMLRSLCDHRWIFHQVLLNDHWLSERPHNDCATCTDESILSEQEQEVELWQPSDGDESIRLSSDKTSEMTRQTAYSSDPNAGLHVTGTHLHFLTHAKSVHLRKVLTSATSALSGFLRDRSPSRTKRRKSVVDACKSRVRTKSLGGTIRQDSGCHECMACARVSPAWR